MPGRLVAVARSLRPENLAMAAAGVAVGAVVAGPSPPPLPLVAAAWAAALVAGFGNLLNDVMDRDLDRAAHPGRPIARGAVSAAAVRNVAIALAVAGLVASAVAGVAAFTLAAFNIALLVAYELRLKARGLAGNLAVSWLVASTFLLGALAAGTGPSTWGMVTPLAIMAGLATLARELLKDVEDMAADGPTRTTFPMRHGRAAAVAVACVAALAAVALSSWPMSRAWSGHGGPITPWVLSVCDAVFVWAVVQAPYAVPQAQRLLKAAMALALVAFLAWPIGAP